MSRKLTISPRAKRDLQEIGDHIAKESPRAAAKVLRLLLGKCVTISKQPLFYAVRADVAPGFRRALVKPYGIWFVIGDEGVRIERIVHGSRDLPALFESGD